MRYSGVLAAVAFAIGGTAIHAETVVETRHATHMGEPLLAPDGVNRRLKEARRRVPAGYKRAWADGRLNALRAAGTASGKRKMEQVWSNTVPRKLLKP